MALTEITIYWHTYFYLGVPIHLYKERYIFRGLIVRCVNNGKNNSSEQIFAREWMRQQQMIQK